MRAVRGRRQDRKLKVVRETARAPGSQESPEGAEAPGVSLDDITSNSIALRLAALERLRERALKPLVPRI